MPQEMAQALEAKLERHVRIGGNGDNDVVLTDTHMSECVHDCAPESRPCGHGGIWKARVTINGVKLRMYYRNSLNRWVRAT